MSLTPRLDSIQSVSDSFTGQITMFGGTTDPTGWFICDGRAVSRTDYANLFAVIGTNFGEGDGILTFNLPDARGNFARGAVNIANQNFGGSDTFVDGDVTVGTENINMTGHPFVDLQRVQLTTSGTLPTGLDLTTDYFVIRVDDDNIMLASTRANAIADTPVDITAASGGGTHTIAANDVDTTAETIEIYNHGLNRTGFAVRFSTSAADLPAGLAINTTYYVRVIDSDSFEVYDTRANAINTGATTGRVDITDIGTGYHTLEQWEDPDESSRVAHAVGGNSSGVGAFQDDAFQGHYHRTTSDFGAGTGAHIAESNDNRAGTIDAKDPVDDGTNGTPRITYETRPCNFSVNYIIKY